MKLEDAIFLAPQMPEGSVVCAKEPFYRGAEAVIAKLTDEYRVPEDVRSSGYQYFLEASGIEELLEALEQKECSRETQAEFVIHYATFDAYPSWFNDLRDK